MEMVYLFGMLTVLGGVGFWIRFRNRLVNSETVQRLISPLEGDSGGKFFSELLEIYTRYVAEQLIILKMAGPREGIEAAKIAHAIKSASLNIGALRLARLMGRIERRAREGKKVEHLIAAADGQFRATCEELGRRARLVIVMPPSLFVDSRQPGGPSPNGEVQF